MSVFIKYILVSQLLNYVSTERMTSTDSTELSDDMKRRIKSFVDCIASCNHPDVPRLEDAAESINEALDSGQKGVAFIVRNRGNTLTTHILRDHFVGLGFTEKFGNDSGVWVMTIENEVDRKTLRNMAFTIGMKIGASPRGPRPSPADVPRRTPKHDIPNRTSDPPNISRPKLDPDSLKSFMNSKLPAQFKDIVKKVIDSEEEMDSIYHSLSKNLWSSLKVAGATESDLAKLRNCHSIMAEAPNSITDSHEFFKEQGAAIFSMMYKTGVNSEEIINDIMTREKTKQENKTGEKIEIVGSSTAHIHARCAMDQMYNSNVFEEFSKSFEKNRSQLMRDFPIISTFGDDTLEKAISEAKQNLADAWNMYKKNGAITDNTIQFFKDFFDECARILKSELPRLIEDASDILLSTKLPFIGVDFGKFGYAILKFFKMIVITTLFVLLMNALLGIGARFRPAIPEASFSHEIQTVRDASYRLSSLDSLASEYGMSLTYDANGIPDIYMLQTVAEKTRAAVQKDLTKRATGVKEKLTNIRSETRTKGNSLATLDNIVKGNQRGLECVRDLKNLMENKAESVHYQEQLKTINTINGIFYEREVMEKLTDLQSTRGIASDMPFIEDPAIISTHAITGGSEGQTALDVAGSDNSQGRKIHDAWVGNVISRVEGGSTSLSKADTISLIQTNIELDLGVSAVEKAQNPNIDGQLGALAKGIYDYRKDSLGIIERADVHLSRSRSDLLRCTNSYYGPIKSLVDAATNVTNVDAPRLENDIREVIELYNKYNETLAKETAVRRYQGILNLLFPPLNDHGGLTNLSDVLNIETLNRTIDLAVAQNTFLYTGFGNPVTNAFLTATNAARGFYGDPDNFINRLLQIFGPFALLAYAAELLHEQVAGTLGGVLLDVGVRSTMARFWSSISRLFLVTITAGQVISSLRMIAVILSRTVTSLDASMDETTGSVSRIHRMMVRLFGKEKARRVTIWLSEFLHSWAVKLDALSNYIYTNGLRGSYNNQRTIPSLAVMSLGWSLLNLVNGLIASTIVKGAVTIYEGSEGILGILGGSAAILGGSAALTLPLQILDRLANPNIIETTSGSPFPNVVIANFIARSSLVLWKSETVRHVLLNIEDYTAICLTNLSMGPWYFAARIVGPLLKNFKKLPPDTPRDSPSIIVEDKMPLLVLLVEVFGTASTFILWIWLKTYYLPPWIFKSGRLTMGEKIADFAKEIRSRGASDPVRASWEQFGTFPQVGFSGNSTFDEQMLVLADRGAERVADEAIRTLSGSIKPLKLSEAIIKNTDLGTENQSFAEFLSYVESTIPSLRNQAIDILKKYSENTLSEKTLQDAEKFGSDVVAYFSTPKPGNLLPK